jgi:uncharacterized protein YndB with AHSA1/START domain
LVVRNTDFSQRPITTNQRQIDAQPLRMKTMTDLEQYAPGPASGAQEEVWQAVTDPAQLREWAPFVVDGNLGAVGATVKLTWVGNPTPIDTRVTRADAPEVLEFGDIRWQLEDLGDGTRLTLWHSIDRRFIAWGAAGWHIACDVLDSLLAGTRIGRVVGADAMKFAGWQRLVVEYAKQFGVETPGGTPKAPKR